MIYNESESERVCLFGVCSTDVFGVRMLICHSVCVRMETAIGTSCHRAAVGLMQSTSTRAESAWRLFSTDKEGVFSVLLEWLCGRHIVTYGL